MYESYKKLYKEANDYFWSFNPTEEKIKEYSDKLKSLREQFTKEEWEELIKNTTNGRAKAEYVRMMKEKYPN